MEIEINEGISLLDQAKIQAQVLLPVIRAFRQELGQDKANAIARDALRQWARKLYQNMVASMSGGPLDKWMAMNAAMISRIGDAVDIDLIKQGPEALEFNITGCRYAEFFRQIGEPELGFLLLCETDFHVVQSCSPEVRLTRTQTIMEGAKCCDFRYQMKGRP